MQSSVFSPQDCTSLAAGINSYSLSLFQSLEQLFAEWMIKICLTLVEQIWGEKCPEIHRLFIALLLKRYNHYRIKQLKGSQAFGTNNDGNNLEQTDFIDLFNMHSALVISAIICFHK